MPWQEQGGRYEYKHAIPPTYHECMHAHIMHVQASTDAVALAKANERADLLQYTLDQLDALARQALEEAQQRCDRLQQELNKAITKAELHEIFRITDQDCSSFIDADELLTLSQAVNLRLHTAEVPRSV